MPNPPPYKFRVKLGFKWVKKSAKQIKVIESKLHRKPEITF